MKASFVLLILIGFASLPGRLSAQSGGPVKELTTVELSSTIPGRELEIRFVGSSGASSLVGGPMRTAGGSASTFGDVNVARGWVVGALDQKAQRYSADVKATTILAIDVRHIGVLVSPAAVNSALTSKAAESGFLGVGLIGPHASRVTWLTEPLFRSAV